jgi:hypothetical protein
VVGHTHTLLRLVATLSDEIKTFDQRIDKLAAEKYMETQLLRQVVGVSLADGFQCLEQSLAALQQDDRR